MTDVGNDGLNGKAATGLSTTPVREERGVRLRDIERTPVSWLWKPFLQRGALNVITGDPGIGKTSVLCAIAAAISTGSPLPGQDAMPPGNCWLMTAEDGASDTISWRLDNQGADQDRVWVTDRREVLTASVVKQLKRECQKKEIVFLGVDPVQAWMGKDVDAYRANETREWGAPLRELAMDLGIAVSLVRHRRKAQPGENRLYSGMGSIDMTAVARSEISVYRNKEGQCYLQRIKGNVGVTDAANEGLEYVIEGHPENDHGVLVWQGRFMGTGAAIARTPAKLDDAKAFLLTFLADGPKPVLQVWQEGAKLNLTQATLERAKKELKVASAQEKKAWFWALPG